MSLFKVYVLCFDLKIYRVTLYNINNKNNLHLIVIIKII